MRRLDRATYAIFLLVLLADVARGRASVPVAGDAGSILRAAGQFQPVAQKGTAAIVARSPFRTAVRIDTRSCALDRLARTFSGWSKKLFVLAHSSQAQLASEVAQGFSGGYESVIPPLWRTPNPALGIFEHTGSPAP